MEYTKIYVNGKWSPSNSKETIDVENPADRSIIANVPSGNEIDVNQAVKAAKLSYPKWSGMEAEHRLKYLTQAYQIFAGFEKDLVDIEMKELGQPEKWTLHSQVKGPIARYHHYLDVFSDFKWQYPMDESQVIKESIGVVACLCPWNYPLNQIIQKVIPALLTGNAVILKPSQITPLSAYYLAESFHQAGLPAGVFNLIPGKGSQVGNILAKHPDVDMISFTGSTNGGKEVGKLALDSVKRLTLELGGKSASVVLPGADYSAAVQRTLSSIFYNSGQTCSAFSRMLVPRQDLSQIESLLVEESKNFTAGDPFDDSNQLGPLSSKKQFDKVNHYLKLGLEEGARLLVGQIETSDETGYYVQPAIFTDVKNDMTIAQEEIFGPVLCVIAYDTVEEAIELANDSIYGLSGAVFGPEDEALQVARQIKSGDVYINNGKRDLNAPFGGYKQSGIGRESGILGLEEFVQPKSIYNQS